MTIIAQIVLSNFIFLVIIRSYIITFGKRNINIGRFHVTFRIKHSIVSKKYYIQKYVIYIYVSLLQNYDIYRIVFWLKIDYFDRLVKVFQTRLTYSTSPSISRDTLLPTCSVSSSPFFNFLTRILFG